METFSAEISIGDAERRQWLDLSVTVDTGAFMTFVPDSLLRKLGITADFTENFRTSSGGTRRADVAHAWIRANGREGITLIAFDDYEADPVMGRLAVNSLLLTADPVARKLVPMTNIPL